MIKIQDVCPLCSLTMSEQVKLLEDILDDMGWESLPPGWDRDSLLQFARSLTDRTQDDPEGFWTECFEKMEPHFGEEGAKKFCSALKDEYLGTTYWREGPNGDED